MKSYFMFFAGFMCIAQALLAMEVLDEYTIESDSHKGVIGKYTFNQRIVHAPSKVDDVKKRAPFPQFTSDDINDSARQSRYVEMGHSLIVQNEEGIISTSDIRDCIGISVWDPLSRTAALYHASKMELRKNAGMFNDYFLDFLKEKISKPEATVVKLASCYWSKDLFQVVDLLEKGGFNISGLWVPDAFMEDTSEFVSTTYINKGTTPKSYHSWKNGIPSISMKIDIGTGKVDVKVQ